MGKKKKKLSQHNEKVEKILSYGIISGLSIGVLTAFILFILTDNMFWMVLPLITTLVGFAISTIIIKVNSKTKSSTSKSRY